MSSEQQHPMSSGVEELIRKLKDEGVAAGQEKAERIIAEAEQRADVIVQEAERKAEQLIEKARLETEAIQSSGQDALRLAARDAFLSLRDRLNGLFGSEVLRKVGRELSDEEVLRRIIIELAGQVRGEIDLDAHDAVDIQVGRGRTEPKNNGQKAVKAMALALTSDFLRSGVNIEVGEEPKCGLMIQLDNGGLIIDFSDETVAALLLERLQPCFRDLLQGAIE